jgi:F-type H+-transporting ATPase subunit a
VKKQVFIYALALIALFAFPLKGNAQHDAHGPAADHSHVEPGKLDIKGEIFGHIRDAHDWHITSFKGKHFTIPLPVVLYNKTTGSLNMFMSSKFHHGEAEHAGYRLDHHTGKIESTDGSEFFDISITKNVVSMILSILLMLFIFTRIAKKYKSGIGRTSAPTGLQNGVEATIGFIKDSVAVPNLGKDKYMKYMPFLLTLFFFIWVNNMFGMIPFPPGSVNLTGNIAVALVLALIFFVIMLANSNKHFWGHMFNPPGVPFAIKIILVPIEIASNLIIKPAALAIRLFANIFAGHTIILCVIFLIFIFSKMSTGAGIAFLPVSIGFTVFMFFLELLVAAIQAFIFTNLAAVFIGQAIEEPHH